VTAGGVSGRTFDAVLPTILAPGEDIQLRHLGGSGYVGNVTIVSLTRGPASTTVNIAYLQYFNATQTACNFGWEVVAGA
jgi:hypothetical protein